MAHSLERRWAKLVNSYARLKELYEKSLERERHMARELRVARDELQDLRRAHKEYDRASRNTMLDLFGTVRYAMAKLIDANDRASAEKLGDWLEIMEATMQPVANVEHLIQLLEEWCDIMPLEDPAKAGLVWMKTQAMIQDLKGTDAQDEG